ncbi:MAG: hypothetical protein ABIH37_04945 [archaeon]
MEYKPNNPAQKLAEYIKKNLKKGYTLDSLKFSLINQGYTKISVENAINLANKQLSEELPEVREKPRITYKVITEDLDSGESNEEFINLNSKKSFWQKLFG